MLRIVLTALILVLAFAGTVIAAYSVTTTLTFNNTNQAIADITTGTNEDLTIAPNGTGLIDVRKGLVNTGTDNLGVVYVAEALTTNGQIGVNGSSSIVFTGSASNGQTIYGTKSASGRTITISANTDADGEYGITISNHTNTFGLIENLRVCTLSNLNDTTGTCQLLVYGNGMMAHDLVQLLVIPDTGDAAVSTENLNITSSQVEVKCEDVLGGCAVTVQETSAKRGMTSCIIALTANLTTFPDVVNVFNAPVRVTTTGLGEDDSFCVRYTKNKSNNLWVVLEDN